jgi:hypothetical protein
MKTLLVLGGIVGAASLWTLWPCGDGCCGSSCEAEPRPLVTAEIAVRGDYLEVRDASVFAGACHTGSELGSQGRRALIAWSFDGGAAGGADLAGVRLLAAVASDRNLAEGAARRSVVYVDAPRGEAQGAAALQWLTAEHGAALGTVLATHAAPVQFERRGEHFAVHVPQVAEVRGVALADGSCCSMPEERWYEPLAAAAGAPVGVPEQCSFAGAEGLAPWSYTGANTAFVTSFGAAVAAR